MRSLLSIIALVASAVAHAEVYRCQVDGRMVYTDKPCAAGAQPVELTPATVIEAPPEPALAREWDARQQRERKGRESADKAWLDGHRVRKTREDRVRAAQATGKVVKGMTPAEVRQMLGQPGSSTRDDGVSGDREKWIYQLADGRTQTVSFADGAVSTVKISRGKSRK